MKKKNEMQYCFALWATKIKEHALEKSPSNEELIRNLFRHIRKETGVTDRVGQTDWVAKETVSALINRRIDLPKTIHRALLFHDFTKLCKAMDAFYAETLSFNEANAAARDLVECFAASKKGDSSLNRFLSKHNSGTHPLLTWLLVEAAKTSNKLYGIKKQMYAKGNNTLSYIFDDIITMSLAVRAAKRRTIVVIPVDANFHFHVTKSGDLRPCVSPNSIHGKWVLRLGELGVSEQEIEKRVGAHPNGKIGDIGIFEYENVLFYLLACSLFDEKNVAHATKEDIKFALEKLLQYHNDYGQGDELFIPLVGTGNSRAKLGIVESFNLIKQTILDNEQWHNGSITIVVHNNALKLSEELEKNVLQN